MMSMQGIPIAPASNIHIRNAGYGRRGGRSICTGARRRAHAGSEQTGEKGRDRFHVGFTQIIT